MQLKGQHETALDEIATRYVVQMNAKEVQVDVVKGRVVVSTRPLLQTTNSFLGLPGRRLTVGVNPSMLLTQSLCLTLVRVCSRICFS